ncbi:uncharacterized protein LOC128733397 isoform X2 [Sabethes cyaneus]|uniref:uncharacterized protein LOC128733397 isoform X2 n=1 Tax=Sabethes cyaneus TaxID=53552 RepID=UPI00237E0A60|nr:uncharacterized protein LOC128733397 isoform X2 [Sabethes cyaneus]
MPIDSERVIALVFERKPIWDKRLRQHNNRPLVDKLWRQIAHQMGLGLSNDGIKKRWRSLRDHFLKELKKVPPGKLEEHERYTAWQHFERMLFVKDMMKPKRPLQKVESKDFEPKETDDSISNPIEMVEMDALEFDDLEKNMNELKTGNDQKFVVQQQTSSSNDDVGEVLKGMEHREAAPCEEDDDVLYFKSLLPYVRKLKPNKKMRFRIEVQHLVLEHVYQERAVSNGSDVT